MDSREAAFCFHFCLSVSLCSDFVAGDAFKNLLICFVFFPLQSILTVYQSALTKLFFFLINFHSFGHKFTSQAE